MTHHVRSKEQREAGRQLTLTLTHWRDKCDLFPECVWFVPERIGVHWGAFGFIFCKIMCITSLCILLCMHQCAWVIIYVHVVRLHSFWVTFHCIHMHSIACFTVPYNCIFVSCILSHFGFILYAFHFVIGACFAFYRCVASSCILMHDQSLHYAALCCISMHFDAFWCDTSEMRPVPNVSECIRMLCVKNANVTLQCAIIKLTKMHPVCTSSRMHTSEKAHECREGLECIVMQQTENAHLSKCIRMQ